MEDKDKKCSILNHKIVCKRGAAELRDGALFKDPPAKDERPICFLPMPVKLICSISLSPATIIYESKCWPRTILFLLWEECEGCISSLVSQGALEHVHFVNKRE
jgi:hypothetical protein